LAGRGAEGPGSAEPTAQRLGLALGSPVCSDVVVTRGAPAGRGYWSAAARGEAGTVVDQRNRIERMFGAQCMIDCISPSVAKERAETLFRAYAATCAEGGGTEFFARVAQDLLAQYLLAAAVLGEGADTVLAWIRSGDPRPWEALAQRPDVVPAEWPATRAAVETMPEETRVAVFASLQAALAPARTGV
jgi:hypothetical protein